MQAIQWDEVAAPLYLTNVEKPHPEKGQVLVKQRYSSINPMDYQMNKYNIFRQKVPVIPGYDVSGTVVEV